jgi:hypothetical protein
MPTIFVPSSRGEGLAFRLEKSRAGFNLPGRCLPFPAWPVLSPVAMVRRLTVAWSSLFKEVAPL